jgi:hypothetical protein
VITPTKIGTSVRRRSRSAARYVRSIGEYPASPASTGTVDLSLIDRCDEDQ